MSDDLWIAPAPTIPPMSDGDLLLIGNKVFERRGGEWVELPPAPWWQRVLNYIENKYDEWRYDL